MGRNFTHLSIPIFSSSLARVTVPENVYAAIFLLEGIDSLSVSAEIRQFLEQAGQEIRTGQVTDQTLEKLISLQPHYRAFAMSADIDF